MHEAIGVRETTTRIDDLMIGDRLMIAGFPEAVLRVEHFDEGTYIVRTDGSVLVRDGATPVEVIR